MSLFDGENQTEVVLTFHLQPVDFYLLNPSSAFHVDAFLSPVKRSSGFLQLEVTLTSVGYSYREPGTDFSGVQIGRRCLQPRISGPLAAPVGCLCKQCLAPESVKHLPGARETSTHLVQKAGHLLPLLSS